MPDSKKKEIVLSDISPHGKVQAIVEDNGKVVYFYLNFVEQAQHPDVKIKSCWVRNRLAAPEELDAEAMRRGDSPLLPADCCAKPEAGPAFKTADLRVVWFEEGDGAALLDGDGVLAVIPAWSGLIGDFHGYARDCSRESPLCWPLPTEESLRARVNAAEEFWKEWRDDDYWTRMRDPHIEAWEKQLGPSTKYYAIDGGLWPPKAMLRFDLPDRYVVATVGVSLLPQPGVEMLHEDARPWRRIELAAQLDRSCPEAELTRFAGWISGQSGLPWHFFTFLGDGHTMPCEGAPLSCGGGKFPSVLFVKDPPDAALPELPTMRGDPVNLLWCVPVTAAERAFAEENSSAELWARLKAAGHGALIRAREPVV